MNLQVRGTSKKSSIRGSKSKINDWRKKLIKERYEEVQITGLHKKSIKEIKELVYRQTEKKQIIQYS